MTISLFADYDVLALSETWLIQTSRINVSNFCVYRRDSHNRFGGDLMLAIRPSLPYTYIDDYFVIDGKINSIAITIHLKNFDLILISIYRYPSCSLSPAEYDSLFKFCQSFSHMILAGDFNAHHNY